jgi:hypothetical protein
MTRAEEARALEERMLSGEPFTSSELVEFAQRQFRSRRSYEHVVSSTMTRLRREGKIDFVRTERTAVWSRIEDKT